MVNRAWTLLVVALDIVFLTGCPDPGGELCDEPEGGADDEVGAAADPRISVEPVDSSAPEWSDSIDRRAQGDEGPTVDGGAGFRNGFRNWGAVDPRIPVTSEGDLQSYPLRTVAQVELRYPGPNDDGVFFTDRGTGFLVGPRHLLTNRHVGGGTWDDLNMWIEFPPDGFRFEVFPGRSNDAVLNGGMWTVERVIWNPFPPTKYDDYAL